MSAKIGCTHLMHLPSGKCLGCGEQHQPLPDYEPGDDDRYLDEAAEIVPTEPTSLYEKPEPFTEAIAVLDECRRYLTDFGSVEPSQLVGKINATLTMLGREQDERCYRWQHESANRRRGDEGKPLLTYGMFQSGSEGDEG